MELKEKSPTDKIYTSLEESFRAFIPDQSAEGLAEKIRYFNPRD